jgi:hypothetical protein
MEMGLSIMENGPMTLMLPVKLCQRAKGVTGAQILGNILILGYD